MASGAIILARRSMGFWRQLGGLHKYHYSSGGLGTSLPMLLIEPIGGKSSSLQMGLQGTFLSSALPALHKMEL